MGKYKCATYRIVEACKNPALPSFTNKHFSMIYLKFAYLAEFAVAFNLAFGEFKQEEIAKDLDERIKKLDKEYEVPLDQIAKAASPAAIASRQTDYADTKPTWLSKSVLRFDAFRNYRKQGTTEYKPFKHFFSRILLFSTNPKYLSTKSWIDSQYVLFPLRVWLTLPRGLLASWTYSKTNCWNYQPCFTSIILWALMALFSFLILLNADIVMAINAFSADATLVNAPSLPAWYFGIAGLLCAIFSLRPLSYMAAKMIGRIPVPRGRYYQMMMVVIVSVILVALTVCEVVHFHMSDDSFERLSYFLIGLLAYATALPLMLLAGHLLLETTVSGWTEWAEKQAKESATDAVEELKVAASSK